MTTLRLRPGAVEWRAVEGEILALEVDSSTYIAANASGALLWERLAEGSTRERLVDDLVAEFGVERQQAEGDVDAFLETLRSRNLLEEESS